MSRENINNYRCDVLVIGGGQAGCWAAIRARDFANKVILVDKGKVSKSGMSPYAGGAILAPTIKDNLDLWLKEIVENGEYMNDQEWMKIFLPDLIERVRDLEQWGVPFEKDPQGKPVRRTGKGHIITRQRIYPSIQEMAIMRQEAEKREVAILDRTMVTDLLSEDGFHPTKGRIAGAIGFNARTGEKIIFQARATVIATGGADYPNLSGEGVAMGFRAGAEVSNMEFNRFWSGGTYEKKYSAGGINKFQGAGLIFRNARGERFMEKYFPELKERSPLKYLGICMVKEAIEGKGPIYGDMRHFSDETINWFKNYGKTTTQWEKAGIDIKKQLLLYHLPSGELHFDAGGLRNNPYCETNLPGLYAAGAAGGFPVHGVAALGGANIAMCCVSGYRAGEYAGKFAMDGNEAKISQEQADFLLEDLFQPLGKAKGIKADAFHSMIQELLSPAGIAFIRNRERIRRTMTTLENWKSLAPQLIAEDVHELVKANGVKNYLQCAEITLRACLEREESRGAQVREDFPYRDDINLIKTIVISRQGEGISIKHIPIPIYRYPVRPEKYEKIPYPIPLPKL